MDNTYNLTRKHIIIIMIVYALIVSVFYFAAYESINYRNEWLSVDQQDGYIHELRAGTKVEQNIGDMFDYIEYVYVEGATFARKNEGTVILKLCEKSGNIIKQQVFDMSEIEDNSKIYLRVGKAVNHADLSLEVSSDDGIVDKSITLYCDSSSNIFGTTYTINGVEQQGNLQLGIKGGTKKTWSQYFGYIALLMALILLGYLEWTGHLNKLGKKNVLSTFLEMMTKYGFLIKQLVARDFKTKYKRSILGVLWSLLNPLMIMGVQYILFSTFFRANIENYPVYLFGGSVLFSFFTDAVGGGLYAIVGNASLITKVYVPKYIYPIAKVLSTAINLLFSMIPLAVALFITHVPVTKAYLLIPFVLFCLLLFCAGMSFVLSASMVFFRDTQFIWGVVSMVWMYATPLFYPESILPDRLRMILRLNPMYHYVFFFRTVIIDGVSPVLTEYVWCLGSAAIVLALGVFIYKKTEGKFALFV